VNPGVPCTCAIRRPGVATSTSTLEGAHADGGGACALLTPLTLTPLPLPPPSQAPDDAMLPHASTAAASRGGARERGLREEGAVQAGAGACWWAGGGGVGGSVCGCISVEVWRLWRVAHAIGRTQVDVPSSASAKAPRLYDLNKDSVCPDTQGYIRGAWAEPLVTSPSPLGFRVKG
jgi:hypothetical protein